MPYDEDLANRLRELLADEGPITEKKMWSAVAALEEQASVLRYLQRSAAGEPAATSSERDEAQNGQDRYVEEVSSRAADLRTQVRAWSNNPPQVRRIAASAGWRPIASSTGSNQRSIPPLSGL